MTREKEKLLFAFAGIKEALQMVGFEEIKNTLDFKDGSSESFDCVKVVEDFIVNYVKKNGNEECQVKTLDDY